MKLGQGLALAAWLLVIAWLVLFLTGSEEASGLCLLAAGWLLFGAAALYGRPGDPQLRITSVVMVGAGVFFAVFGFLLAT